RVSFHVGAQAKDDFLDRLGAEAFLKLRDAQVLGSHAAKRGDFSAHHMVLAVGDPGFLDADKIHSPLDDTDQIHIAAWVYTDRARNLFREGAAGRTGPNPIAGLHERPGELSDRLRLTLHEMQSESLCGARTNPRQRIERLKQLTDRVRERGHRASGPRNALPQCAP